MQRVGPSYLATCTDVKTERGSHQAGALIQRQAPKLGDEQEVEGGPSQLLLGGQQPNQLLDQFTC